VKFLPKQILHATARVMAFILAALATQFIIDGIKAVLVFNYLFKTAKTSDSRVFWLKDCVNGIGTTTAETGVLEYFFGKWTLYFLPNLPIGILYYLNFLRKEHIHCNILFFFRMVPR
jgi:hypothetical protein